MKSTIREAHLQEGTTSSVEIFDTYEQFNAPSVLHFNYFSISQECSSITCNREDVVWKEWKLFGYGASLTHVFCLYVLDFLSTFYFWFTWSSYTIRDSFSTILIIWFSPTYRIYASMEVCYIPGLTHIPRAVLTNPMLQVQVTFPPNTLHFPFRHCPFVHSVI